MENANAITSKNFLRIVAMAVLTLLAGGLIGGVAFGISKIIYLVFIFPLIMGFGGGIAIQLLAKKLKIHAPVLGILFGILMGISIYGAFYTAQYLDFRREMTQYMNEQLSAEYGQTNTELVSLLFDQILLDETGHSGLIGYMSLVIKDGISIGQVLGGESMNIGPFMSVVYMIFEVFVIGGVAIHFGKEATSTAFCEACDEWYGPDDAIGAAPIDQTQIVVDSLRANAYMKLGEILVKSADIPSVDVYVQSCTNCQTGNSILKVKHATYDAKGKIQVKTIYTAVLTPRQRDDLVREVKRPR